MTEYTDLLFDLDGTLTDPAEGIIHSILYALREFGYKVPPQSRLLSFIGPPLLDSFSALCGCDRARARELVDSFRVYFKDRGILENRMYDGIPDLLASLKEAGYRIYLATSKPEAFARRVLDGFSLTVYFDGICGSEFDGKRDKKADVIRYLLDTHKIGADRRLLMIGDTKYDALGAAELKIPTVGVSYGYGSATELTAAGAIAVLPSVAALKKYLI